jgi:putative two-component system response regulator
MSPIPVGSLLPALLQRKPVRVVRRTSNVANASSAAAPLLLCGLAAEITASHHERWDRAGYPYRPTGEAIPLSGRIVAVADIFDALMTEPTYKQAWSPERTRQHLIDNVGAQFDRAVVRAFLSRWA